MQNKAQPNRYYRYSKHCNLARIPRDPVGKLYWFEPKLPSPVVCIQAENNHPSIHWSWWKREPGPRFTRGLPPSCSGMPGTSWPNSTLKQRCTSLSSSSFEFNSLVRFSKISKTQQKHASFPPLTCKLNRQLDTRIRLFYVMRKNFICFLILVFVLVWWSEQLFPFGPRSASKKKAGTGTCSPDEPMMIQARSRQCMTMLLAQRNTDRISTSSSNNL